MKVNLSTFPKAEDYPDVYSWNEAVEEWKDAFTKELKDTNNFEYTHLYKGELWIKIKEILGK